MGFRAQFRRVGHRWRAGVWLSVLLGWSFCGGSVATVAATSEAAPGEYDVKAMLLYNFPQFIEWPENLFATPDAPLVIGVLGRDPFGRALDELTGQTPLGQHGVVIRRLRSIDAVRGCHILFISPSERDSLQQILLALRDQPVLTVADFDGFARRGGMIELYKSTESKVRVRVNLAAAKSSSLVVSAKLLRVADVVGKKVD